MEGRVREVHRKHADIHPCCCSSSSWGSIPEALPVAALTRRGKATQSKNSNRRHRSSELRCGEARHKDKELHNNNNNNKVLRVGETRVDSCAPCTFDGRPPKAITNQRCNDQRNAMGELSESLTRKWVHNLRRKMHILDAEILMGGDGPKTEVVFLKARTTYSACHRDRLPKRLRRRPLQQLQLPHCCVHVHVHGESRVCC